MGYTVSEIELKCLLAVERLSFLEHIAGPKEDDTQIPDTLIEKEVHLAGEKIIKLLINNDNTNILEVYHNYCDKMIKTPYYKNLANFFVKTASLRMISNGSDEKNDVLDKTPDPIKNVMNTLAKSSNELNDLLGDQFNLRYFISQYLVYKQNETNYEYDTERINKMELFEEIYERGYEEGGIADKIRDVQENYPDLFGNTQEEKNISYETVKKRMQKLLPNRNKSGTMNNSQYLNVFEQNAFSVLFLIYHTKYQRFMSNSNVKKPPEFKEVKEVKEAIQEFLEKSNISGINDKLFLNTVMQDTYHFALFNALTKLTMAFTMEIAKIMESASNYDSLSGLFIVDRMIDTIPSVSQKWRDHFQEITTELDKFSNDPEVEKAVLEAIKDADSTQFAEENLTKLIEKYDTIYKKGDVKDENNKSLATERKMTEDAFKNIVKYFYQTEDDQTAYEK